MSTDQEDPARGRVLLASGPRTRSRSRLRPSWPSGPGIGLLAAASAVAGAVSGVHPTSVPWANAAWPALLAAAVTLAAGRGRRSVLWLAAWSVLGASTASVGLVVQALVGMGLAVAGHAHLGGRVRAPLLSAGAAAIAVAVLLHQARWGFHGASALLTAVAIGPVLAPAAIPVGRAVRRWISRWDPRWRRLALGAVLLPFLALLVSALGGWWGARELRASLGSARAGDVVGGSAHLAAAQRRFGVAHWLTEVPSLPLRLVPVLGQHVDLLQRSTGEGVSVSRAGDDVLAVGSYRGIKTADGRIDLDRMRALVGPVERARTRLAGARRQLRQASSPWLLGPARSQLDRFGGELADAGEEAALVEHLARTLPAMLGGDGERVYFVAFLNPAEERGGGGFLGSYAELRADDGRLQMARSGSVTELVAAAAPGARTLDGPADYLRRYGRFRPADFFQDVPFSPNFPYTGDVISQLYPQSGGIRLDGVLAVDPVALAALLRFTGPITVDGLDEPLTAENAAQVILKDQYVLFDAENGSDQTERRDLLDSLAERTFRALLDGELPAPEDLADVLGPMVDERRLQMYARRPAEERLLTRVGMDGSMGARSTDDYLMVSHQNLGNSKIDTFLFRSTCYRATVDPSTGRATARVRIELTNSAPASGLPGYVIGNSRGEPWGSNVMQLSVYSRLVTRRATIDGAPLVVVRGREAGASVATARVVVPPGETRTVEMTLAGTLDLAGGRYRLRAVPQAGYLPDDLTAEVATAPPSAGSAGQVLVDRPRAHWVEPLELSAPVPGR